MSGSLANRGVALESALDTMHRIYERQGLASVIDIPTRLRVIGRGTRPGSLLVVPDHSGDPDYHVQAGGVSYLFDAKSCDQPRWPLDKLTDDQAARFDRHSKHGGRCFVLLSLDAERWVLPWHRFAGTESGLCDRWSRAWAIRAGHGAKPRGWASVGPAECCAIGSRVRAFDWLNAAMGEGWT